MIEADAACPSEDELAAFAAGLLREHERDRVAQHTAKCSGCFLQLTAADGSARWDGDGVQAAPELLAGRYQLVRKLGEGGMGVVYEAQDAVLGERVALKMLRGELASDERALDYLKSEAKLARQIGHEHVCRVYDLGSQTIGPTTLHYLSMELLRGPSLRSLLAEGRLDPRLALRIADQVLCGLQAAHAAGVLHRDLKPDNMLLRLPSPHAPHAVITDFGLARAFQAGQRHVSASRILVGSAAYLAPEQLDEAPLTEATDLYSFGIVLFELLTGKLPFSARTPLGVALRRLHSPPPRPSALRPELGARYDAFVLRCLARDPCERYRSAASARAALLKLMAAEERGPGCSLRARAARVASAALFCGSMAAGVSLLSSESWPTDAAGSSSIPQAWSQLKAASGSAATALLRAASDSSAARVGSQLEAASASAVRAPLSADHDSRVPRAGSRLDAASLAPAATPLGDAQGSDALHPELQLSAAQTAALPAGAPLFAARGSGASPADSQRMAVATLGSLAASPRRGAQRSSAMSVDPQLKTARTSALLAATPLLAAQGNSAQRSDSLLKAAETSSLLAAATPLCAAVESERVGCELAVGQVRADATQSVGRHAAVTDARPAALPRVSRAAEPSAVLTADGFLDPFAR